MEIRVRPGLLNDDAGVRQRMRPPVGRRAAGGRRGLPFCPTTALLAPERTISPGPGRLPGPLALESGSR